MGNTVDGLPFAEQCDIATKIVDQSLRANNISMGASIVGCLVFVAELIAQTAESEAKFNEDLEQAVAGLSKAAKQLYIEAAAKKQRRKH